MCTFSLNLLINRKSAVSVWVLILFISGYWTRMNTMNISSAPDCTALINGKRPVPVVSRVLACSTLVLFSPRAGLHSLDVSSIPPPSVPSAAKLCHWCVSETAGCCLSGLLRFWSDSENWIASALFERLLGGRWASSTSQGQSRLYSPDTNSWPPHIQEEVSYLRDLLPSSPDNLWFVEISVRLFCHQTKFAVA